MTKKNDSLSFTLGEIILFVAVISLVISFLATKVHSARKDTRDVQRHRDLSSLRSAIGIYRDQNDGWPNDLNDLETAGILQRLPTDPSEDEVYGYTTGKTGFDMCLVACLEDPENADNSSVCSAVDFAEFQTAPSYIQSCDSENLHYSTL